MSQADEVREINNVMRQAISSIRVAQVKQLSLECGMRKVLAAMNQAGIPVVYYADLDEMEVGGQEVGRA